MDDRLYEEAILLAQNSNYTSVDAENELFGLSHIEAGATVMEKWNMPDTLILGAAFHHNPTEAPQDSYQSLAALIGLADLLSNLKGYNFGTAPLPSVPEDVPAWLILKTNYPEFADIDVATILAGLEDQMEEMKKTISLIET